ncbi:helix-turn-helix transcriptional regulator [Nonomuraea sp. SBT364]|uniref:helix-turn-helix transcriptional regulator n=1 Tax=Nonomuraea sp. SBT364 TaxID=1580530 RepID=UPI000A77197B|nr:helix-turn-helix transcriptional regulator [Nonomuraea sp. SBT364]
MSLGRHSVTVTDPTGTDPLRCEEFGYGLGRLGGILVLKYRSAAVLEFGESRQDFLHQLYWSPDGMLATRHGARTQFVGRREAFWAHRAVTHEVRAADRQTVYRICLREVPPALDGLRAGAVSVGQEAARLIQHLAGPGLDEAEALAARDRIMAGLGTTTAEFVGHHATGTGFALTVARALSHDPGDEARLDEWAERLHVSVKTLQRDFEREFGMPYSRVRTKLRLSTSRVLLETRPVAEVARRVGYSSPSAFISAFTKEYGCTPGRYTGPS